MPESRGRHRRPRQNSLSRTTLTVTAGGAGIAALPLLSGAPAHAAAPEHKAPESLHRTAPQSVRTQPLMKRAAPERPYVVRSGDTLSGIADTHGVRGGWQALYERNKRTVGRDPDLILPGQKLMLEGRAPARSEAAAKPKPAAHPKPARKAPAKTGSKTHTAPQGGSYTTPVTNTHIGTGYGVRGSLWSRGYHTGVDFPVPVGTGVRAVGNGTVVSAGWGGSYGYQVVVKHADGKYTQYGHLSAITVHAGQHVNAGQRIARSGATGNVTGPHLHFEARTGPGFGSDINPLAYLRSKGVRI